MFSCARSFRAILCRARAARNAVARQMSVRKWFGFRLLQFSCRVPDSVLRTCGFPPALAKRVDEQRLALYVLAQRS